jgi:IS5 family transposase
MLSRRSISENFPWPRPFQFAGFSVRTRWHILMSGIHQPGMAAVSSGQGPEQAFHVERAEIRGRRPPVARRGRSPQESQSWSRSWWFHCRRARLPPLLRPGGKFDDATVVKNHIELRVQLLDIDSNASGHLRREPLIGERHVAPGRDHELIVAIDGLAKSRNGKANLALAARLILIVRAPDSMA